MQNTRVKALVVTKFCSLISLVNPNLLRSALHSCIKTELFLMKQCKSLMELSCATSIKTGFEVLLLPSA
jgi:hypothetical protein